MAKTLEELKKIRKQMVINPHTNATTSGTVATYMKDNAWKGEIAVQHFANDNAAMWTLGKDNNTAVEFASRKTTEGIILSASPVSSGKTIVVGSPSLSGVNIEVNVDTKTIGITGDGGGSLTSLIKVYRVPDGELRENEKYKFYLTDKDGNKISGSSDITIVKEASLDRVEVGFMGDILDENTGEYIVRGSGNTSINFIYIIWPKEGSSEKPKYSLTQVDVSKLIYDAKYKEGLTATTATTKSGVSVSVKIDKDSDNYLTVSMDGVKLSGVSNEFKATKVKSDDKSITVTDGTIHTTGITKTNIEVNIDNVTVGKETNGQLKTLLKVKSVSASSDEVREEYNLQDTNGNQIGDSIKIYKDQNITRAYIGHIDDTLNSTGGTISGSGETSFNLVKINATGKYELLAVNMQTFIEEEEVGSGLTVTNHILHGVVANKGDKYLFVDGSGFFLSGLSELVSVVSGETMTEAKGKKDKLGHVTVDSAKTGDHITYTIDKYDVASNSAVIESADTLYKTILSASPICTDQTILISATTVGRDLSVNIDKKTIGKAENGVLSTLLKISAVTPSSATIREEYTLVDGDGKEITDSEHIKIYKDKSICSAFTEWSGGTVDPETGKYTPPAISGGTEVLVIVYTNAEGKYELVEIDLEGFILEAEFKDGFRVDGHNVYVKIDDKSEEYLSVSSSGLKLSGVSAINAFEVVSAETSSGTVKEAWKIYNSLLDRTYGKTINIYKDQHVTDVHIGKMGEKVDENNGQITSGTGSTAICVIRLDENGKYKIITVDMQNFIEEEEVKNGLKITDHILHGVVASKGDPYLFVDGDGFFLSGSTRVVSGETMTEAKGKNDRLGHVTVDSAQTGDHITYTIGKYDIAADSVVGSGWTGTTITEVIIENEEIVASALTEIRKELSSLTVSSSDKSINVNKSESGTDIQVNIDSSTIVKGSDDKIKTNLILKKQTSSEATIKEEYKLISSGGSEITGSDVIQIYEDSSFEDAYLGHMGDNIDKTQGTIITGSGSTALCFKNKQQNKEYVLYKINAEDFVEDKDISDGLQVVDHEVKVKIDDDSQENLTVSKNGVKLSGVERVVELTQAAYDALAEYEENTTYVITDASEVDLSQYWTSAQTKSKIEVAIETESERCETTYEKKGVASSLVASESARSETVYQKKITGSDNINISSSNVVSVKDTAKINNAENAILNKNNTYFAPTTAGAQHQPLLAGADGVPTWSNYKFLFITQDQYDNIPEKDSQTIYFIIG